MEDSLECIKTINSSYYTNYKLLVIDNNSPDGSGYQLKVLLDSNDVLILPKNTGYAGGNNCGIEIALADGAEYIFIVNPDVRLKPESIGDYVRVMQENKNAGGLNPIQLSPNDGSIDSRFVNVLSGLPLDMIIGKLGEDLGFKVDTLFGAAFFLSRESIEKVGGFDPLYFAYGEEQDLCRRIKYFGFDLLATCRSPVLHLRPYDNKVLDPFRGFLRLKGRYLYQLKDINRCFFDNLKHFYYELRTDFINQKTHDKSTYYLYLKMFFWVIINMLNILKSRRVELEGFAHLSLTAK